MSAKQAVLLVAHGTPDSLDEIPDYLANVTGGRAIPQNVIDEIRRRYAFIAGQGEISPLTRLTRLEGELLSAALGLPVYIGMRNWKPYIADALAQMRSAGITEFAVLCLAPQNSRTSVGLYRRAVSKSAGDMRFDFTEAWADHPLLIEAFAERLRAAWTPDATPRTPVLFTAHSVPCRTLRTTKESSADPYAVEAKRTAALVAKRVGVPPDQWFFAFQSQGVSNGPDNTWIGPTVEDTLTALRAQDVERVVVQPVGFLCDHVEILYDIDIHFREFASDLGMELVRVESLNDSPLLIRALADLARQGLERLGLTRAGLAHLASGQPV